MERYTADAVYAGGGRHIPGFGVKGGAFYDSDGGEHLGAFVCPAFADSHMHLLGYGGSLTLARLEGARSVSDVVERLRGHGPDAAGWIRGRGWNQDDFEGGARFLTRGDLDRVSLDAPAIATRVCGHVMVANSRALALAGVADRFPDGLLREGEMALVRRLLPPIDRAAIREMLLRGMRAVNRFGVARVHSDDLHSLPGVPARAVIEAYRSLDEDGLMTVRVREQAQLDLDELRECLDNPPAAGGMFALGALKIVADGSLGARTARLSRPYADAPDTRGEMCLEQAELDALILCAHEGGMQVAVHAIGDEALDRVLDAFSKAQAACPRADARHGVVHCQITRPDQLARIRRMGLIVYAQPAFLEYDRRIVESRVGAELAKSSYAFSRLSRAGVPVSGGSDCPVEPPDALRGMAFAVENGYAPEEAIDLFSRAVAYAGFEEGRIGEIAPGQIADFAVLDCSPLESGFRAARVTKLYLGGKPVSLS